MDHMPLPSSKAVAHVSVPYLGHTHPELIYDYLGFEGFPSRKGFKAIALTRLDKGKTKVSEQACVLQSWCFFALVIEVSKIFDIALVVEDFVTQNHDGQSLLTTFHIPDLLHSIEEMTRHMDYDPRAGKYCAIKPLFVACADAVRALAGGPLEDSEWATVHLEVLSIGEYMYGALRVNLRCGDPTPSPWWARNFLPPKYMVEAGWCPSLAEALLDEEASQSFIYYVSRADRRGIGVDHVNCTSNYCTLDTLNHETYKTKHAYDCRGTDLCLEICVEPSRWTQILEIVDKKQVPLITVVGGGSEIPISVEVTSSEEEFNDASTSSMLTEGTTDSESHEGSQHMPKPYVCISHVWSE